MGGNLKAVENKLTQQREFGVKSNLQIHGETTTKIVVEIANTGRRQEGKF